MIQHSKQGFTLVELIVVITILAILGTIAFISLAGYSKDARNSVRLSDTKNAETSLELFAIGTGKYPVPSNATDLMAGSEKVGETGTIGESVATAVRQLSHVPLDPKTEEEYGYSVVQSGKLFQIKTELEDSLVSVSTKVQAADGIVSKLTGNYNDMYVQGANGNYYTAPSLFPTTSDILTADFVLDEVSEVVSFTGELLGTSITSDFVAKLQTAYSGSTFTSKGGVFTQLASIDSTNTGALLSFGSAVENGGESGDNEESGSNGGEEEAASTGDPYWDDVVLLLPLDTDANDVSNNNTTVSNIGGLTINGTKTFNGANTLESVGEGVAGNQYLNIASDTAFDMGNGSFTVEGFFNLDGVSDSGGRNYLFSMHFGGATALAIDVNESTGLGMFGLIDQASFIIGSPVAIPSSNTWHHIAFVYDSSLLEYRLYLDGVQVGGSHSETSNKIFSHIQIGTWTIGQDRDHDGGISNFRITKGVARYSGTTFDAPTEAFPTN